MQAGGQDVGRRSRGRGLGERLRQAGEQQCRRFQADVDQGDCGQARADRRADRRRGGASIPASVAPGFATQFCDVEVDPETGKVTILRFVAAQDVGRAIHPSYVEGQIQGGVTQGIGWALNEEYIYDSKGHMENPGFLDYRIPVASDLPMIEPVMVEVPNPNHPYGAKGVAEVNICPPMAAIANAIERAVGRRLTELPMSPPKVLAAIDARKRA